MTTITLPIYNTEGKEINTMKLDSDIFGDTINEACLYQVVNAYRANQRQGLAQTKTRGEVSGGGRKPWKQKGTGRARVGSIRSPLWRHGGVVFGPHPRDFSYTVPKKIKFLALKSALNAKIKENNFIILDSFKIENSKTKEALKIFSSLKINPSGSALLLLDKIDNNLKLALRNIGFLTVNRAADTNTYEILAHQKLIITESAIKELMERLKDK
jgi:large subunit ribosomal protein L4